MRFEDGGEVCVAVGIGYVLKGSRFVTVGAEDLVVRALAVV